jgi:hypothetical protein
VLAGTQKPFPAGVKSRSTIAALASALLFAVPFGRVAAEEAWPSYALSDGDIAALGEAAHQGGDWPLMAALHKEAGEAKGGRDCRVREYSRLCFAAAQAKHEAAYFFSLQMGDDSLFGRAAVLRPDGRVTLFSYDSSPCGQMLPSGRCGYSLLFHPCDKLAPAPTDMKIPQPLLCESPRFELDGKS